jgi:hypothetical protein
MAALNGQRTWAQILAEQSSHLFNQGAAGSGTYPTDTMLLNITNKWYKRFCSKYNWLWTTVEGTIPTVQGTTRIVLPDTVRQVENLNIRNIAQNIPIKDRQSFLASYPSGWTNTGQGIPLFAVEAIPAANNAKQYDLWPTPNAIYTINYDGFTHVSPLVNTTDYSIIPPEYDDILVHGPVSESFIMQNDPSRAQYHEGKVQEIMQRAWYENENMIMNQNQMRGYESYASQSLVFPYHSYGG